LGVTRQQGGTGCSEDDAGCSGGCTCKQRRAHKEQPAGEQQVTPAGMAVPATRCDRG
jgi:hypothetical protein